MNHELLKRVIYDHHEIIARASIVPREYHLEANVNYVLTGLRRAGKSTMLYAIVQELIASGISWDEITYVNFEDERLGEFSREDFDDIVAVQSEMCGSHGYFFFDEIQNIDGWEKFARRMADAHEHVCITGSNAKMLSREIEGALGGRYTSKKIDTYSFSEFLDALGIAHGPRELVATRSGGIIRSRFEEYLRYGGFPENTERTDKREYVSGVYQKVLLGDIIARSNICNPSALSLLVKKIAESVRSEISHTKLSHTLKAVGASISTDTVIDYVSFIKESFLVFSLENHVAKFAERESTPKYYFSDNGLLNLFLFGKDSALLENAVAVYLHRRFPEDLCFLKSSTTGIDLDFYLPEARMAVQVAYSLDEKSSGREVGSLVKLAGTGAEVDRFVIVTFGEERTITEGGVTIEVVPAHKFLLE